MTVRFGGRIHLPHQRTPAGRLATETGLVVAGIVGVVGGAAALSALLPVDGTFVHVVVSLLAAGMGTAAVAYGHVAGRIAGNRRAAWLIPALAVYSVIVVPTTAMPATGPEDVAGRQPGLIIACVTVALLLLAGIHPPGRSGVRAGWVVAGAGAALTLTVDAIAGMSPVADTALAAPETVSLAMLVGWWAVSTAVVVVGYRAGSAPLWRVGLGFGVIAAAHLSRTAFPPALRQPGMVFATLRLLGVVVVLLGVAQLLRRALNTVLTERFQHDEERRLAGLHAERAAQEAAEREHELRNGLSALAGLTQVIGGARDGELVRRARCAAAAELSRLTEMVGSTPPPRAPTTYSASSVVTELTALWRVSGMDVEADVPPGLTAVGRPTVLAQILTNVLTNCARHAPGSAVRIAAWHAGNRVVVEVRDDGPGIADGVPAPTAGAGIGLALSGRLLTAEGGTVRLHPPDPNRTGCTVSIELPAAVPTGRPAAVPTGRPAAVPTGRPAVSW